MAEDERESGKVRFLIETATNSTEPEIDKRLMKSIKYVVRNSDYELKLAAQTLMDLMKRDHSQDAEVAKAPVAKRKPAGLGKPVASAKAASGKRPVAPSKEHSSEATVDVQPLIKKVRRSRKVGVNPDGVKEAFAQAFAATSALASRQSSEPSSIPMEVNQLTQMDVDLPTLAEQSETPMGQLILNATVPSLANSPVKSHHSHQSSSAPNQTMIVDVVQKTKKRKSKSPTIGVTDPKPLKAASGSRPSSSTHTLAAKLNIKLSDDFVFNFSDEEDVDVDEEEVSLEEVVVDQPHQDSSAISQAKRVILEILNSPGLPSLGEQMDNFLNALKLLKKNADPSSPDLAHLNIFLEETPKLAGKLNEAAKRLIVSTRCLNEIKTEEQKLIEQKGHLKELGVKHQQDKATADQLKTSIDALKAQLAAKEAELSKFDFLAEAKGRFDADCVAWASSNKTLKQKLKVNVPQMEKNRVAAEKEQAAIQASWDKIVHDYVLFL